MQKYKFHSYKFAPGHYYVLKAFLTDTKIKSNSSFSLDAKYLDFGEFESTSIRNGDQRTIHVHLNSSILTLIHIFYCWILCVDTIILMHEPILDLSAKLKHYPQYKQKIKITIIKYVNDLICVFSKKIIVFSKNAESNLRPSFKYKSVRCKLPFVYQEAAESGIVQSDKVQISYIGAIADDHNFRTYLNWVQNTKLNRHEFNFSIFTRNTLSKEDKANLDGICDIIDGKVISITEIAMAYKQSDLTWCVYKSANQSGVLPMALMHGSVPLVSEAFGDDMNDYNDCTILVLKRSPKELDMQVLENVDKLQKLQIAGRAAYDNQHNPEFHNWGDHLSV